MKVSSGSVSNNSIAVPMRHVPERQLRVAWRFKAGIGSDIELSPEGMVEKPSCSAVPSGLVGFASVSGVETPGYFRVVPSGLKSRRVAVWLLDRILPAVALILLLAASSARAQDDTNEVPQILPPHAELPPTFWEQHGVVVIVVGMTLLALLGLTIWLRTRPKPPVMIPPEVQAREALAALPIAASEGERLSQVSRIMRHYVQQAFELPRAELNTTEFCLLVAEHPAIGPRLAGALVEFLRESDRRKFSPEPGTPAAVDAVTRALGIIEQAEGRRATLRAQAASATAKPTA
jgi:hypothetical protein